MSKVKVLPRPGSALDADTAAVKLDEPLRKGETQARSLLRAREVVLSLSELVEDDAPVSLRDADPRVLHRDAEAGAQNSSAQRHRSARPRELDGVGQEVEEHLLDLALVGHHDAELGVDLLDQPHVLAQGPLLHLWAPPTGLGAVALALWFGVCVFFLHTALTVFEIPHRALGAELSPESHDRTRVFAASTFVTHIGGVLATACVALLERTDDPRSAALPIAVGVALATAALIALGARQPGAVRGVLHVW